jgi:hypothetical protein
MTENPCDQLTPEELAYLREVPKGLMRTVEIPIDRRKKLLRLGLITSIFEPVLTEEGERCLKERGA